MFVRTHCASPLLHAQHLVSIFLSELRVDALVDPHGVHGQRNGQQCMHLLVLLVNLKTKSNTL